MNLFKSKQEPKMEEKGTDKSLGKGNGSARVYQVQVRVRDSWPAIKLGGMVVDQVWRDLHLQPAQMPVGVPTLPWNLENIEWGVP